MNKIINLAFGSFASNRASWGLLALRLVVGVAFMFHGWGKIQNPFGWMGPDSPIPGFLLALAALAEFGGGLALIVGLLTPLAALGQIATMLVAIFKVLIPGGAPFIAAKPGENSYELALVFLVVNVLFLLAGPGRLSLDYLLFGKRVKS